MIYRNGTSIHRYAISKNNILKISVENLHSADIIDTIGGNYLNASDAMTKDIRPNMLEPTRFRRWGDPRGEIEFRFSGFSSTIGVASLCHTIEYMVGPGIGMRLNRIICLYRV